MKTCLCQYETVKGKVSKQTMVRMEWQVTHRDLHSGVYESERQWCFPKPNRFNIVREALWEDSFAWRWRAPCASVWGSEERDREASVFDDLGWERSASPGSVCVCVCVCVYIPSIIQVVYLMVLPYDDVLQDSLTWSYFIFWWFSQCAYGLTLSQPRHPPSSQRCQC